MRKYFLAAALLATGSNLAIASSPDVSDSTNYYILLGFGAIVILLTLAVWWLTFYVGSTITRIFSKEKREVKVIEKQPQTRVGHRYKGLGV